MPLDRVPPGPKPERDIIRGWNSSNPPKTIHPESPLPSRGIHIAPTLVAFSYSSTILPRGPRSRFNAGLCYPVILPTPPLLRSLFPEIFLSGTGVPFAQTREIRISDLSQRQAPQYHYFFPSLFPSIPSTHFFSFLFFFDITACLLFLPLVSSPPIYLTVTSPYQDDGCSSYRHRHPKLDLGLTTGAAGIKSHVGVAESRHG